MQPGKEDSDGEILPPEMRRRRVPASEAILIAQEAAAQVKNDVYSSLRAAHERRKSLPSEKLLRLQSKDSPAAATLGRAKQVQYTIGDALGMFRSFRSNFFAWTKDHNSRAGQPRPPRYYRRGRRCRLRFDYQDFKILVNHKGEHHLCLPPSMNLPPLLLAERDGSHLLQPGDRLVEVRAEPCRSRKWVDLDLVIRRSPSFAAKEPRAGTLLVDLGVRRLVTCLDEKNLQAFCVDGSVAKAILARGAKWHAKLRREADLGARHGKARAGALATRNARQMEDLMKKVARLLVTYTAARDLRRIVIGRNKHWKQGVNLGRRQNQLFTFIPHEKLLKALRTKCARAGLEFIETEESHTSKTDHFAGEAMGQKPEGYRWLGSRSPHGLFRSSVGIVLQADVNGCIGIGRKVAGEEWLANFRQRLGSHPGTRLVPRKVHVNGSNLPAQSPGVLTPLKRGLSSRAWISTKVALAKARLIPASSESPSSGSILTAASAVATHKPQGFSYAA